MLIVPSLIGALVALVLGIYGRVHSPTGIAINIAGFSSPGTVKSSLATGATLFAIVQVGSALVMYGKIPRVTAPDWIGGLHRWSGRIAFLLAVPVAIHCLYALGFQQYSTRVLLHSVFGCLFFGAFTVKMLVLPSATCPGGCCRSWAPWSSRCWWSSGSRPPTGSFPLSASSAEESPAWPSPATPRQRPRGQRPPVPPAHRTGLRLRRVRRHARRMQQVQLQQRRDSGQPAWRPVPRRPRRPPRRPRRPAGSGAAAAPAALASTSDIPVGGGKILTDKKIVITQPQSGAFHAFSAVCTHAGCIVGSVSGGTINCPCHGSRFNISTGAVVNGPATSPLPAVTIKVQGTSIVQA